MPTAPLQGYPDRVREEQRIIADWMSRQMERHRLNPQRWAAKAGMAPTTVSRAMAETYESVTSVPTLHALARALGEPSILDFLSGEADTAVVSADVLTEILSAIVVGRGPVTERSVRPLAEALAHGLSLVASNPAIRSSPDALRAVGQSAGALFPAAKP